jgi:hypothetical protein
MPKGPQGQKRPADVTQNAVMVMRIATGEVAETTAANGKNVHASRAGRLGGKKGGAARAKSLTKEQRSASAKKAAKARWSR